MHIYDPDKVSDITGNSVCNIYPDPVKSILTIDSPWPEFLVTIFSFDGKVVTTRVLHDSANTIDLSNLINGIYLLKLEYSNTVIYKKLIKL